MPPTGLRHGAIRTRVAASAASIEISASAWFMRCSVTKDIRTSPDANRPVRSQSSRLPVTGMR
jgi:hypothetical protein